VTYKFVFLFQGGSQLCHDQGSGKIAAYKYRDSIVGRRYARVLHELVDFLKQKTHLKLETLIYCVVSSGLVSCA